MGLLSRSAEIVEIGVLQEQCPVHTGSSHVALQQLDAHLKFRFRDVSRRVEHWVPFQFMFHRLFEAVKYKLYR